MDKRDHHGHPLAPLEAWMLRIEGKLDGLNRRVRLLMTDTTELSAAVDRLDQDEVAAAGELKNLADQIAGLEAGSVTQEQIDALTQHATAVAEKLEASTADPGQSGGTA